ncbi:MAG: cobalamin biosynthesis protein CobQ [Pseudomonadota bacterium]
MSAVFGGEASARLVVMVPVLASATGLPGDTIWNETYWTEPWQTIGAVVNSLPLAAVITTFGIAMKRWWLTAFGLAMLVHIGLDLPLHGEDAHRHFWPLSDWRFISPVSYWNPSENGRFGILVECAVVAAGSAALWTRFPKRWVRLFVGLAVAISAAMVVLNWLAPPAFGA